MGTYTLRPTSLAPAPGFPMPFVFTTPVGGSFHALGLDDETLATYWNFMAFQEGYRSSLTIALSALPELADTERVRSVRVRVKVHQDNVVPESSFLRSQLLLADVGQPVLVEEDVFARPTDPAMDAFASSSPSGALWSLAPDGEPWTVQHFADLRIAMFMDQFTPDRPSNWPDNTLYYSHPTRLYEVFVDVTTNLAPTLRIVAPSGDQTYDDGSTTKGSATLTSASAAFSAADDGLTLLGHGSGDDTFADGSGGYVLASPTAAFTEDDVGLEAQAGDALPGGAVISELIDATRVRLSETMRQSSRTVSDARYSGPVIVRINTLVGSPIVWLSAPSYDSPFLDCAGVPSLGTDIGRRIVGDGIPEGATVSVLVNPFGTGCVGSYYAGLSANATKTVSIAVAEKVADIVESATADFTADDVGALISGADIPTGATITEFLSEGAVRISAPVGVKGEAKSISISRPVPPSDPVTFTIRSRRAVRTGVTVAYVSATSVTLSEPAVLTLAGQTFTLLGRPEVISDVARPQVEAAAIDAEGDSIVAWQAKVFTAAQYGAAGFDPDASEALHDSGELLPEGRSLAYRVTEALPDAVLDRFYVKGADEAGYGSWTHVGFTLAVPKPAVPTLSSALPDDLLARVALALVPTEGIADSFNRADDASSLDDTDTGETWAAQTGVFGTLANKGRLSAAAARTLLDAVTYLPRVVTDGVTQLERVVTDGVTSTARTVTDGVTTAGRTVTDGVTIAGRAVTGCYNVHYISDNSVSAYLNPQAPRYVFSQSDIGKTITGTGIPASTTIIDVLNGPSGGLYAQVLLSQNWTGAANAGPHTVSIGGFIGVTSATAVFVAGDVGKPIAGGSLPVGTTITSRISATEVVTSATSAASETGLTIHIGGLVVTSATAAFVAGDVGKPIAGGSLPGFALIVARQSATAVQISLPATSAASSVSVTLSGQLLTSATAQFTQADVGKIVTGAGIPAATTLVWVTGGSTVVMSAAATASAAGVTVTIGDSAIVDSATAVFVAGDVGKAISGLGVPAGATVATRVSATRITLSADATEANVQVELTIGTLATIVDSATGAFVAADLGKKIVGGSLPTGTTIAAIVSGTRVTVTQGATSAATGVSLVVSGQEVALVELSAVDVEVRQRITLQGEWGTVLRALNGTNLIYARLAPGVLELWKRQVGATTLLRSGPASAVLGGTYEVAVRAEGRDLVAFLDDVEMVRATLTFTEKALFTGAGYTKGGQWTNGDTASRFDDFVAAPAALTVLVERSDDDGTTWSTTVLPVGEPEGSAGWPVLSLAPRIVHDYLMPRGRSVLYRARATRSSVAPVYSDPTVERAAEVEVNGVTWWKHPWDPSYNLALIDTANLESLSDEAQGIAWGIGAAYPIVRSDVVRSEIFEGVEVYFGSDAEFAAFERLRRCMRTVLYQTVYGDDGAEQHFLRLGPRNNRRLSTTRDDMGKGQRRLITVSAVEVAAPA